MKIIMLTVALVAVTGCTRPEEVRSLAKSALPIAANLKSSGAALQARFGQQRVALERRASELAAQTARARAYAVRVERDWRFGGDTTRPKQLAILREEDAALLADPLASLIGPTTSGSKLAAWDFGPLNSLITGLDDLKKDRKPNTEEMLTFFHSINEELKKPQEEQAAAAQAAAPKP